MAKIIITLRKHPRGLAVECSSEADDGDTPGLKKLATAVSAGLAGIVHGKVMSVLKKDKSTLVNKEGKSNVH
ncbi:TPA: hypothetical protein PXQ89_000713 [Yersinia enterocolitica]|nr:hypothetical protein [Yersinia enterocolitica]